MENGRVIERQQLSKAFSLHASGNRDQAEIFYQEIIGADPRHPDSLHTLGGLALCLAEDRIAIEMLGEAIQLNPDQPHYYKTLGDVYKKQRLLDKAIRCYRKALLLDPTIAENLVSLASVYHLSGRIDDAAACYQKALRLKPDYVQALVGQGTLFKEQGRTKDAEALYLRSLKVQANAGVEIKSALLFPVIWESVKAIQHHRAEIRCRIKHLKHKDLHLVDPYLEVGTTGFHLAYQGVNNKDIQESIASLYLQACSDLSWVNPACRCKKRERGKIAVGFISQFLHQHTIGYLNHGIIKNINREKFQVTVFRFRGKDDQLSKAINQAADTVIYLPHHLMKARRIIAEQTLDILFYLDIGMDSLTYFLAFSRLAPVQCTTWGHADTTGIPNLDYYLSSLSAEPEQAQQYYSEKLILLNQFPMYCRYPEVPSETASREKFGLPTNRRLYMCCQSLFKIHPDFDALIAAILGRDPSGILLLFEGKYRAWSKLLYQRFARSIPGVIDRIHFYTRVPGEDFLSIIGLADVMVDTLHFCGGYTSLLCLAGGIPIVTLPGSFMRGRMTYGFYKQMGIFDCVAADIQNFADIAVTMANDTAWRDEISNSIRARAPILFEDMDTVRDIERFFEWAVTEAEGSHQ